MSLRLILAGIVEGHKIIFKKLFYMKIIYQSPWLFYMIILSIDIEKKFFSTVMPI